MTAFDRFDPFERRITDAIDEIAAARVPDYLDNVFQRTTRMAQRPRWSFPERWSTVDTTLARPILVGRRAPVRSLIILAALLALAVAAALYVGSQPRPAPPFGPAANGALAFSSNGDIYLTDTSGNNPKLLVGGEGDQLGPSFSPDGLLVAYDNIVAGVDHLWVIDANGQSPREVFDHALVGDASPGLSSWITWSGDSQHLAIVTAENSHAKLWVASVDGSKAQAVELGGMVPNRSAVWDPLIPNQVLIRAMVGGKVDLVFVNTTTGVTQPLHLPWPETFGADWDLSGHVFSDDGQRIAYNVISGDTVFDPPGYYRIGVVNRDGTNPVILPGPADLRINEGWPIFSPDGRWVSTERFAWNDADGLKASLAVLASDGSGIGHDVVPAGERGGGDFDVTWAPDSSALIAWDQGRQRAYLINPVTGDRQLLPWLKDVAAWQRRAP